MYDNLHDLSERAADAARTHPKRDLRPGYLSAVHAMLLNTSRSHRQGVLRCCSLDGLAVQKVIHRWSPNDLHAAIAGHFALTELFCDFDNLPAELLSLHQLLVSGQEGFRLSQGQLAACRVICEDLYLQYTAHRSPSIFVLWAALAAYSAAVYSLAPSASSNPTTPRPADLDTEANDMHYPDDWPVAYTASVAYSGGFGWLTESSAEAREEYWAWLLEIALPAAARAFSDVV